MTIDDEIAGITCLAVLDALGDYVDGELDQELRGRVEAHVARCRNCERFGDVFAAIVRGIREHMGADADPDEPALYARLRVELERER
jgi:anti-sigma factor RsiW